MSAPRDPKPLEGDAAAAISGSSRAGLAELTSARQVNPEAGDHVISGDPVERAAAEAAVRASWREFPYYGRRYGERGWRFSLSDTGWIETLCHLPKEGASAQIAWLGGVLAARGMPRYLLERHLSYLQRELVSAKPAREEAWRILLFCEEHLRARRLRRLSNDQFRALAQRFEEKVRACTPHVANMGVLVVGAVTDESDGVDNAVESLSSWAGDADRFGPTWVAAVQETLGDAREACSPSTSR